MDLVLAEPSLEKPERIVWMELKDIGRSDHTLMINAKGLGQDLAALWSLRPVQTRDTWLNPPPHVVDRGRIPEWQRFAPLLTSAKYLISQVVIVLTTLDGVFTSDGFEKLWLQSFEP